ncbi:phosphatidylinositol 3,4,5-trisphosphate 5-phosphatase 2 [Sphaerodactylus townsendi]|uniref:phosphatidylinositol 3,4,5-trisphosphate 5-phosphatase 2 n=1 Tax=Sphaerodactylus townsendi TaxID=933632 RepID=UPI002026521C|nr:phosphatidylinositol 3,4,5-trisphosphate 5-phosphatase 2 [Sphaerodactylus townsendi]
MCPCEAPEPLSYKENRLFLSGRILAHASHGVDRRLTLWQLLRGPCCLVGPGRGASNGPTADTLPGCSISQRRERVAPGSLVDRPLTAKGAARAGACCGPPSCPSALPHQAARDHHRPSLPTEVSGLWGALEEALPQVPSSPAARLWGRSCSVCRGLGAGRAVAQASKSRGTTARHLAGAPESVAKSEEEKLESAGTHVARALCVLGFESAFSLPTPFSRHRFQKHVHTYRILPDEEDFLAVQTSQGVQVRRFKTLSDLIALYLQPNQGLICTLLFPVEREKEKEYVEDRDYSDGEDEKPPLPPRCGSTTIPLGSATLGVASNTPAVQDGVLESTTNGLSTVSHEYLKGSYSLDLEAVKAGASSLPHLNKTLVASCKRLHSISELCGEDLMAVLPRPPAPILFCSQVKLDLTLGDLTKIGKSQKYTLSVDVEGGKLVVLKKQKDSQEDWNTFTHDKIRQLIKSQRVQNKLGIVFEKEKDKTQRKDFIFVSARKREAFCQLLQLMKNRHSNQDEPDMISVFIGTWNMGSVPPPKNITSWFASKGLGKTLDEMTVSIPHDIYVFGSQENSMGDKEWVDFLRGILKDFTEIEYRPIAMQSLWNIKIAVLVKPEHENRISHVSTSCVKTGIANTLGNKGAVGVSFMFNGTSFGFVNCHLTSGNEKTARRNQNYLDILRLLSLGDKQLSSFDISLRFTHLFWFGDLNYRLDMDIQEILNYINRKEFEPLLKVDQLNLEKEKHKIFLRFSEEEITFPPTYRYERGSRDTYVWHKQKPTGVSLSKSSDQAYIEFESVEAIVKTASRTKFFIEFYSTCLEEFKKSFENDSQSSDNINFLRVQWSSRQLPTLKPILSDIEYLQDQHILLTVKSLDGYESYGECVIALKSMIGSTAQQFLTYLSHRGEETGNIRGSMKVRVPAERMGTRERLYEWISIDKDETGAAKGKLPPPAPRTNPEHSKSFGKKHSCGEAAGTAAGPSGKLLEDLERPGALTAARPPAPHRGTFKDEASQGRAKQDATLDTEGAPLKNSFNNPAYYVLEGVPHQLLVSELPAVSLAKPPTPRNKVQITVPIHPEHRRAQQPPSRAEESSEEEDPGVLNLPPPDFPPPPLPKSVEFDVTDSSLYTAVGGRGEEPGTGKPRPSVAFSEPLEAKPPKLHPRATPPLGPSFLMEPPGTPPAPADLLDDRSCSVLQMAKTLSEVDYPSGGSPGLGREQPSRPPAHPLTKVRLELPHRCLHPDYSRPIAFPPRSIRESIKEDLAEEALGQDGRSSSRQSESSVGEWLRAIGMERYEEGLIHNGWDATQEFRSDITEEDLEEAGVVDPLHKHLLLETLRLRK